MDISTKLEEVQKIIFGVKVQNPIVWDLQKLIFTIILVLLLIKPTSNAIFLATAGVEHLPIVYIILAVVALGISVRYNGLLSTSNPLQLFSQTLLLSIVSLVTIGFLLFIPQIKFFASYIFYIFISIFGVFSASQFWILANQLFNAREARKYFGIIGFGAIAGGILGGYLASIISAYLSSEWIPVIAGIILILPFRWLRKIKMQFTNPQAIPVSSQVVSIKEPIRLIAKSRHLSYLAIVITLSVFVSKIIDYQFGYFAAEAYPIEEDLTQFYGVSMSSFNIIALLVQVFLTTRVVGKLGIGYSLLILPIFLLINAGALIMFPILISAVGLKLSDAGLKQSINKAAMELTMMPTPEDIKLKTKTFLDVFVDSLATGISGLILILVLQVFDLPNWIVTAIIIGSICVWLIVTNMMRKEYKKVFRQSLNVKDHDIESGSTILESYRNVLKEGNDFQIIKTLGIIKSSSFKELDDEISKLVSHSNEGIIQACLNCLMYSQSDYSHIAIPLLNHQNQNISILAFEYIINHQKKLDPNFLLNKLNSKDESTQIIALAAYAKEFANDPRTLRILRIEDRLTSIVNALNEKSEVGLIIGCLKTIGFGKFNSYYHLIDQYLDHSDDILRKNAILAAGETRSSKYLMTLAELMYADEVDKQLYLALAKFSTKKLSTLMGKGREAGKQKWLEHLPHVLELIPTTDSIKMLQALLDEDDHMIRTQAIKSLRVLSDKYPLLPLDTKLLNRMLVEETKYTAKVLRALSQHVQSENGHNVTAAKALTSVLKLKIDENLKTVFELLHIIYPPENYLELYGYVLGDDDTLRNNAIEYVDNTITNDIKSYIIPLLEYTVSFDFPTELQDLPMVETKRFLLENKDLEIRESAKGYFKVGN